MSSVLKLEEDCVMVKLNHDILAHCHKFGCGNEDLDEFFNKDAIHYDKELLGKTYCWIPRDNPETNGFNPIYNDESVEKEFFNIDETDSLRTRMMYFDLKL